MKDKRRARRITINGGSAICRLESQKSICEIRDVSRLGISLAEALPLEIGDNVDVEVWWPRVGAAKVSAAVVRIDEKDVGLEFQDENQDFAALIANLEIISQLQMLSPSTLIYSHDSELGREVAAQLGLAGQKSFHAKTALDAIERLDDPWTPISAILVEATTSGLEFANYLRDSNPEIRRIMLSGPGELCHRALSLGTVHELVLDLSVPKTLASRLPPS